MTERKQQLLDIGVKLAARYGVENVTRAAIAKAAKITAPAVGKYLGNRDEMLKAIKKALRAAGKSEPDKKVIVKAGQELRKKPRKVPTQPEAKKPAKGRVTKVVKVPATKSKRAPRPKPTVLPEVPAVTPPTI